jgi:hypothetical protein
MDDKLSFRPFQTPTAILLIGGWGGLALLFNFSLPTLWPRWMMYALIIMAGTGTSLPVVYWFNLVFSSGARSQIGVIVRESLSVGVYFAVLAWLSIGRVLNFPIAVWLGLGFFVIQYLLRLREPSNNSKNVPPQSSIH